MKKLVLILFCFLPVLCSAVDKELYFKIEKAPLDLNDIKSTIKGAKIFATQCMACHSMRFMRFDPIAQENGVLYDKMPLDAKRWTGTTPPPDLSLEARVRGIDWIYGYLHSFYVDKNSSTGFNNLVFQNTAMPNVFAGFQGTQERIPENEMEKASPKLATPYLHDMLRLVEQGSMSPEEFDEYTRNLVNFLAYASDPHQPERVALGRWVLAFLFLLALFSYLVYREYWRDIKQKSQ